MRSDGLTWKPSSCQASCGTLRAGDLGSEVAKRLCKQTLMQTNAYANKHILQCNNSAKQRLPFRKDSNAKLGMSTVQAV
jgi:hypothetical protein